MHSSIASSQTEPDRHLLMERVTAACHDGASQVVVLVGEPGIGKTRMLNGLHAKARELDFVLFEAACQEDEQAIPFSLLRSLIMSASAQLTDRDAERATAIVAELGYAGGNAPPVPAVCALFEEFIRVVSTQAPVGIMIDDAHLGDEESITALSLLARHARGAGLLLGCACRTEAMSGDSRVMSTLGRMAEGPTGSLVELQRLDRAETADVVAEQLGVSPDDKLIDFVEKYSLGNPLFTISTVQLLRQRSVVVVRHGRAYLTEEGAGGGTTQRGALLHRLFMQDRPRRTLARIIAVLGPVSLSDTTILEELSRLTPEEVGAAFDGLIDAGILEERTSGEYFFAHPLVGEMLLEDVGPLERKQIHKDLSRALAPRANATSDVQYVRHLVLGADRGDAVAIDAALRTASTMEANRPLSAAQWYHQALKITQAGDTERQVHAMLGQLRSLWKGSRPRRAVAVGEQALQICTDSSQRRRIYSMVIAATYAIGDRAEAAGLAGEAMVEFPEELRFAAQRAAALANLGLVDELAPYLDRFRALARDGASIRDNVALSFLGFVGSACGDKAIFDHAVGGLRAIVTESRGQHYDSPSVLAAAESLSYLLAQNGYVTDARQVLEVIGTDPKGDSLDLGGQWSYARAVCLCAEGRWDAALKLIRSAVIDLEFVELRSNLLWLVLLEAEIEFARGNYEAVVSLLESAVFPGRNARAGRIGEILLEKARAAAESREIDVARIRHIGDLARRSGWYVTELYAVYTLAVAQGMGAPSSAARERLAVLARDHPFGDTAFVHGLFANAHDVTSPAQRIELALREGRLPWVSAVGDFAAELVREEPASVLSDGHADRMNSEPAAASGPTGCGEQAASALSDDDLQMIRLVREGLNNRQIAEVIHFSRKTVEARLSRLYRLFSCKSRIELVVEATRRGLFED